MEEIIERYKALLAIHPNWCCHITDNGYFSEANLQLAKQTNLKFLLAAKISVGYIAQAIKDNKKTIYYSSANYIVNSGDDYGVTIVHELPHKETEPEDRYRVYLLLYFSPANQVHELKNLINCLIASRTCTVTPIGRIITNH